MYTVMDFENVNNLNIALEKASKKDFKRKRSSLIRSLVHAIKNVIRQAPLCCQRRATVSPTPTPFKLSSPEELDNLQNEALENSDKISRSCCHLDGDLRPFNYTTYHQTPGRQT